MQCLYCACCGWIFGGIVGVGHLVMPLGLVEGLPCEGGVVFVCCCVGFLFFPFYVQCRAHFDHKYY